MLQVSVKEMFFNSPAVLRAVDAATRQVLSKFGSYVRQSDRSSQRRRKSASAPGTAPSAHLGTVKDLTFFAYDPERRSVVEGPTPVTNFQDSLRVLEEGGTMRIRNKRRRIRKLGDGGEVRVVSVGARLEPVYALLTTPQMVDHANRLNAELYGPEVAWKHVAARPHTEPALRTNLDRMPEMWANSVKPAA